MFVGVSAVALVAGLILLAHFARANADCSRLLAEAARSPSPEVAIATLQEAIRRHPNASCSPQVRALLISRMAERDTLEMDGALAKAKELNADLRYGDAAVALRDAVVRFGKANNWREAEAMLKDAEERERDRGTLVSAITNRSDEVLTVIEKAVAGDHAAQLVVGKALLRGTHGPVNLKESSKWLERASAGDDPDAEYSLGLLWSFYPDRQEKSFSYLVNASRRGHADATGLAGIDLVLGRGVAQDVEAGMRFLRASASNGVVFAQVALAGTFMDGDEKEGFPGEAFMWAERAAAAGSPRGQLLLFLQLLTSDGTATNRDRAISVLNRSAEQDYRPAIDAMIRCRLGGYGYPPDVVEAVKWMDRAIAIAGEDVGQLAETKMTVLEQHARTVFSTYDDPRFAGDRDLTRVANTVARYQLKYPTVGECNELIKICERQALRSDDRALALAAVGAGQIFQYEVDMTRRGFHRYGRDWLDNVQLQRVQDRLAERQRELEAYYAQVNEDRAKELRKGGGMNGGGLVVKWVPWKVWPGMKASRESSGYSMTSWSAPAGSRAWRDYMDETFGGMVGVTYGAGKFGRMINPNGINY